MSTKIPNPSNDESDTKEVFKTIDSASFEENQRQEKIRQLRSKVTKLQKQVASQRSNMRQLHSKNDHLRLTLEKEKCQKDWLKAIEGNEKSCEKIVELSKVTEKNYDLIEKFLNRQIKIRKMLSPKLKNAENVFEKLKKARSNLEMHYQAEMEKSKEMLQNLYEFRSNQSRLNENGLQTERNCLRLAQEELKNVMEENERTKIIVESSEGEIGECEEILKQNNEKINQLRAEYDRLLSENANKTEFCEEVRSNLDNLKEKLKTLKSSEIEQESKFQCELENIKKYVDEKLNAVKKNEEALKILEERIAEKKRCLGSLTYEFVRNETEIKEANKLLDIALSERGQLHLSIISVMESLADDEQEILPPSIIVVDQLEKSDAEEIEFVTGESDYEVITTVID